MFLAMALSGFLCFSINGMEIDPINCICISTLTETFSLYYQKHTTIGDLKMRLCESQGVPVYCQKIVAVVPSTDWYFSTMADFMATKTDSLGDNLRVEELVENYGPRVKLELYLQNK